MPNGGSDYTSILDKTDWRRTIHKALEDAVLSIGKEDEFYYNVEQAAEAIKAYYPNWNATKEVEDGIKIITNKHDINAQIWIDNNRLKWAYPWVKNEMKYRWKDAMYREILQFLKDVAGKHRMLLYGRKDTISGSQMNLPGVQQDEYEE